MSCDLRWGESRDNFSKKTVVHGRGGGQGGQNLPSPVPLPPASRPFSRFSRPRVN